MATAAIQGHQEIDEEDSDNCGPQPIGKLEVSCHGSQVLIIHDKIINISFTQASYQNSIWKFNLNFRII